MNASPKIDTHRHLGGCFNVDFVWRVIREHNLYFVAENYEDVRQAMTFSQSEKYGYHRFLDKFLILDSIPWTPELIDLSIEHVCQDLIAESIEYCLIDFSINKYMRYLNGWHKRDVIHFIRECFDKYIPGQVGLILSLKYESSRASQRQYANLINDSDVANDIVGLDLVGDEMMMEVKFHGPILKMWANAGKLVRAHVGEYGPIDNVHTAINYGATNIAHGLAIINNTKLIKMAIANNISFDLGLTSNILTGVATLDNHPLRLMLDAGLNITIGTDDPIQCNTKLDNEYRLGINLGMTTEDITYVKENSAKLYHRYKL